MKSNRVITVAVVLGVVIVAVTFLGAARLSDDAGTVKEPQKILTPVKAGSHGVVFYGWGDVEHGLVAVFPENLPNPSRVKKINVIEGDVINADGPNPTVLVELDTVYADIKIAEATHGLERARFALVGAESVLNQAEDNARIQKLVVAAQGDTLLGKEKELAAAEIELKDKKGKLAGIGASMDPEIQAAEKKLEAARHALDAEKKKLDALKIGNFLNPFALSKTRAQSAVDEAKAAIALQEAQLNEALYGKSLMTLKARVSGKIIRSNVSEGMTFGMQTRQPLFLIQPKGTLIIRAEIDQEFASRIAKGQDAVIQDDGNPNLKWTGKVIRIAEAFLPKRTQSVGPEMMLNDTRVLECVISVDNSDPKSPIRVGQKVKVSIGVE